MNFEESCDLNIVIYKFVKEVGTRREQHFCLHIDLCWILIFVRSLHNEKNTAISHVFRHEITWIDGDFKPFSCCIVVDKFWGHFSFLYRKAARKFPG